MTKKVNIFVGLSGGVDSSVTAALLVQQGYAVTGVYMKNWSQDVPGMVCPWKEDYQDAKRVAVSLGIPFKMYDFQTEYRQKVVNYMVAEYQMGRTPNPDVMCNQEVKFKLFLQAAREDGAAMIATGHYARTHHGKLGTAANAEKDQTYFLYRVTEDALRHTLMPIGDIATKAEVRDLARTFGLSTAEKKDSQGICFVGKVGIKDFLLYELGAQPAGDIIERASNGSSTVIGRHDGAIFYTIGQRHGLDVGGGLPYYVTGKDMTKNEVYVTAKLDDDRLWHDDFEIIAVHSIDKGIDKAGLVTEASAKLQVRTRYRAPLVDCTVTSTERGLRLKLREHIRALTPGQSAVLYRGEVCLGGGIVASIVK